MGRLTMLKGSVIAAGLLMLWALPAQADNIVINNGLGPPIPDNVIDFSDNFSLDAVAVQNVGCDFWDEFPCVEPGDPTTVSLVAGGVVGQAVLALEASSFVMSGGSVGSAIVARDSASVTMSDGLVGAFLEANNSSSVAMSGGSVTNDLILLDSATATMTGGSVRQISASGSASITIFGGEARSNGLIVASNSSSIVIVGTDFEVDGQPVGYGLITAGNATLTGTLASGDSIDNPICHNGGACAGPVRTGSIYLAPPPPYDLTSSWDIEFSDPITGLSGTCGWVVTQDGTIYGDSIPLLIESNCDITGSGFALGALDLNTGVFSAVGAAPQACTTQSVFGTVAGVSTSGTSFCVDLGGGAFSASFTGTSVPEVECNENEDCDTGEACDNNQCVPDLDGDGVPDADDICPGGDDRVDTDQDGFPDDCDIDMTGSWDVETFAGPCTSWVVTETGIDPEGIDLKMNAECEFCERVDTDGDSFPDDCIGEPVIGVGEFIGKISLPTTEPLATGDFEVEGEFRDASAPTGPATVCRFARFLGTTTRDYQWDPTTNVTYASGEYECWEFPESVIGWPGDPFCPEPAAVDLCELPAPWSVDVPCCKLTGWFEGFFDSDGDGVGDHIDNCPNDANPHQENSETEPDQLGDACDVCPFESEDYDGYQDEDGCRDHIDMTGTWDATTLAGECTWEIVQTGTQLDPFLIACGQGISAYASEATIDVNTGALNVTADLGPVTCNLTLLSAQGTSDGDTANGTYWCEDVPGTVFCPVATHSCDVEGYGPVPCCKLTGGFSGTRVPDFVISDAPGGGDCENTRFNGSWNDADKTCTVANVTIHAGESLTVAQEATLMIMSGGSMTFNGGSADNSDTLVVWGTLANDGFMTFNGGDGSLSAYLSVSDGTLTNNGVMQFNGGAGYLSASLGASIGATITNHNVMEFNGGAGEISAGISNTGEIVNDCGAVIDMNGGTGENSATLFTALQGTTINRGTISGVSVGKDPVQGACPEDMTGDMWAITLLTSSGAEEVGSCKWQVTDNGTLTVENAWCEGWGVGSLTVTFFDVDTGEFTLEGTYADACQISASAEGTVAENSIVGGQWTCEEAISEYCPTADPCTLSGTFTGERVLDTDCDFVPDEEDNCPYAANPPQPGKPQFDGDNDGLGCPCDDSGEEAWCQDIGAGCSLHVTNPVYRMSASGPGIVKFSAEPGLTSITGIKRKRDIGLGSDDSGVIKLKPHSVYGPTASLNTNAKLKQTTWQTTMSPDLVSTGSGAPIRFHAATFANGFAMSYEIALDDEFPAGDLEIVQVVELPAGWELDRSELTDSNGPPGNQDAPGRLTIKDGNGKKQVRISSTGFAAPGKLTQLEDNDDFYGIQRVCDGLLSATPTTAAVGPPNEVGGNFYNPLDADFTVEQLLCLLEYTVEENQADGAITQTTVSGKVPCDDPTSNGDCYLVSMVVPAEKIDNNRLSSDRILVGQKWSSLTPIDFGKDKKVHSKNFWACDEECVITGENPTLVLHNTLPASPPTFNALPADYSLLPNGGGTAAIRNAAEQQQTGVGCSGCTWNWTGESKIQFIDGGAGVSITSGRRVGAGDSCLVDDPLNRTTNTGRCELDKVKRGSFRAEKLIIEGSMSGLAASESDIEIEDLTFYQARDPNATDEVTLHAAGGVGCKADSGRRTYRNPSDGELIATCPLDLNGCTEDEVGRGTCLPTHLCDPPSTGICNFKVKRMELHGMNSDNNPLGTDLTVPTGCGLTLASRAGKGEVGGKSYNPETGQCEASLEGDPEVSVIEGFQCAMATSGGANVDPETGAPLEADAEGAVPPNVYCLDKIRADNNEVGLVVGGNVDVRASRLDIQRTQFSAVHVKNSTSHVETVASTTEAGTPCPPSNNGMSCRSPAEELACPECTLGGDSFLATAGRGKSARTKLTITQSNIGIDEYGNPSSGYNPVLPELEKDDDLVATKTLTIGGAPANLYKAPIFYKKGADTMKKKLASIKMSGNNIGVISAIDSSTSIAVENRNSPEGETGVDADDNWYTTGNGQGITDAPLLAISEEDSKQEEASVEVTDGASLAPKPAGSDVPGDHKCYSVWAKGATSLDQPVALVDPFFFPDEGGLSTTATVLQPYEFCNPVNKNTEGVRDPEAHLTCYDLDEDTPAVPTVEVSTQFGTHTVALGAANTLCVPTIPTAVDGVPTGVDLPLGDLEGRLNHFKCYERAKRAKKVPDGLVELEDRFETKSTLVKDLEEGPFLVCNAVDKNGEGIVEGPGIAQHLACWKIQDADGQRKFSIDSVSLENQFGLSDLDLSKARLLCEPAIVQPQ